MYTDLEIETVIATAPDGAYGDYPAKDKVEWIKFVSSVDNNPKSHKLEHYVFLARAMAEGYGSVYPQDFGDVSALESIKTIDRKPCPIQR